MRRYLVSGRVQGVFFRAATAEQARTLGVRGFARNLADGRVEVVAAGDELTLEALERWLWQGPPLARVEAVECAAFEDAAAVPPDFHVL